MEDTAHAGLILNSIGVTLRCMKQYDAGLGTSPGSRRHQPPGATAAIRRAWACGYWRCVSRSWQLRAGTDLLIRPPCSSGRRLGTVVGEGWMLSAIAQAYIAQGLPAQAQRCLAHSCDSSQPSVRTKPCSMPVQRMQDELRSDTGEHKSGQQGTEYKKRFPIH